jgi:hypothetical protein
LKRFHLFVTEKAHIDGFDALVKMSVHIAFHFSPRCNNSLDFQIPNENIKIFLRLRRQAGRSIGHFMG